MGRISRGFPLVMVLVASLACAPAAAPRSTGKPPAEPQPATPAEQPVAQAGWQAEWEQTLAAARKEGTVVVAGPPGAARRKAYVEAFNQKYPDIKVEYTAARGTQIVAKMAEEINAGIYAWDVILASTNPTVPVLVRRANALRPLQEAMILPEVLDDGAWVHGFAASFNDADGKYLFGPFISTARFLDINLEFVPAEALQSVEDLKDPRWAGKIAWDDPRMPGSGVRQAIRLYLEKGEDWLKDLWQRQQILYVNDDAQIADWFVRGRAPLAIGGVSNPDLAQFQKQGLGTRLIRTDLDFKKGFGGPGGNTQIGWFKRAPHPNAAKVFINWYLSREGQEVASELFDTNSRRVDVAPIRLDEALDPTKEYVNPSHESVTDLANKLYDVAKQAIR